MLVSIIIPLYNKEQYIFDTIQSVLGQTYKNIEIIVIDDGSTDKSASIVLSINDPCVKYYKKVNAGVSAARNDGIDLASGDWVMFLDADDTLFPDAIHGLIYQAIKYPQADVITGNYIASSGGKSKILGNNIEGIIPNAFQLLWLNKWNVRLGSFIINAKVIASINSFNHGITIGEDVIFTDGFIKKCIICHNPSIVMSYNMEFSSLSKKRVAVEKIYEWHMVFDDQCQNKFLTYIYYDKLFRRVVKSTISLELKLVLMLFIKFRLRIFISIYYFFKRICYSYA